MVHLDESQRSSLSAQEFRTLIHQSIDSKTPVSIEVKRGGTRFFTFEKFLNENCAVGFAEQGDAIIVVSFYEEIFEGSDSPVIAIGR